MVRTFKRTTALFVLTVFVLSLVPVAGLAQVTLPSPWQNPSPLPWIGSNVPGASLVYSGQESAVNKNYSSIIPDHANKASEMVYSDGTFGKASGDLVYLVRDYADRTLNQLYQPGSYFDITPARPAGVDIATSDFAVEFSFALTDESDIVTLFTPMYKAYNSNTSSLSSSGVTYYYFDISTTGATIFGVNKSFEKPLSLNKWYNAVAVYDVCADSSGTLKQDAYNYKLYINGTLYANASIETTLYGPRYIRMGTTSIGNSANTEVDNWVHYDNINTYSIDSATTFVPTSPTASTLVSNNETVEIIEDTIAAPEDYNIADLKASLASSKANDAIRYYNSDYSALLSDNAPALGANIVIASSENGVERTFSYYTVEKWIKKYPGINDGSKALPLNKTANSFCNVTSVTEGIGGKASDDKYLKIVDQTDGTYIDLDVSPASGGKDVLEFSIYIPSESNGMKWETGVFNISGGYWAKYFDIKSGGIYDGSKLLCEIETDKWYNVAFVTPKAYTGAVNSSGDSLDSALVQIYINGELKVEGNYGYSAQGFRQIRFRGLATSEDEISGYMDNIRIYSGEYEPQYDTLAKIDYKDGIDENNNIIVKGATTVAQLKSGITRDEETTIKVYSSLTSKTELADDAIVQSGYVVAAANKNGSEMDRSYNYYTIDRVKNAIEVSTLVNGNKAKLFDGDDALSVSTEFANYTDSDTYNVTMYAAQYRYGELINVWTDTAVANAGETQTLTCDFAGITDLKNSSIKVILVDENSVPYTKPVTMRYSDTETQATLYIVGSSSTQSYDNPTYPIQGWGYYIDDYLNDSIKVDNRACSGWTTDHFMYPDGVYTKHNGVTSYGTELLTTGGIKKVVGAEDRFRVWSNIMNDIKPGDYVVFMLGINDYGSGNVPNERYMESLTQMYTDTVSKGATFIPITLNISGKDWDDTTGFSNTHASQSRKISAFAATNNLPCIPLDTEMLKTYYDMVDEYLAQNENASEKDAYNYVRNYFYIYAEHGTPPEGWDDFGTRTTDDSGHLNPTGAKRVAQMVAELLAESESPLGDYIVLP